MDTLDTSLSRRGVATIRFNRPDKANSYDQAMLDRLGDLIEQHGRDEAVRIVVLRGAGKHFSAGAAVGGERGGGEAAQPRRLTLEVCKLLDDCPKPTIALVQGACIGGALALACCCDTLIAAEDAAFSIPELRLGFAPGPLIGFFVRGMGARAVRHYLLSGERFSGTQALRMGLAHKAGAAGDLEGLLDDAIEALLLGAPEAQARAKCLLREEWTPPIPEATLRRLQDEFDALAGSAEASEGRASFKEKRKPRWYRPA